MISLTIWALPRTPFKCQPQHKMFDHFGGLVLKGLVINHKDLVNIPKDFSITPE